MADNYLEKRYDEVFGPNGTKSTKHHLQRSSPSLDSLLLKNRSYRGYNKNYVVSEEDLRKMVDVCAKIPSARNQQVLRFRLITKESGGADAILQNIKLGGALPELHLPFKGSEPQAFIIVCSILPETKMIDIDMGIAAQSMLLKSVEMGLNGIIIMALNRDEIREALNLPYDPLMVIAVGKGAETIQLLRIGSQENHNYFRKDGIHYVPKVDPKELII